MKNPEIPSRIKAYQAKMAEAGIDAVIIPRTDAHLSEYITKHWQIVRWLSGFTGSAATMVITADEALLWTDSRYFLQASLQLEGTGIRLMKDGLPETPSIDDYILAHVQPGGTVGIDGMLMSYDETASLRSKLEARGIKLDVNFEPIDLLWTDRPGQPDAKAFVHDMKYSGESTPSRIARVLAKADAADAAAYFTGALDEVAWILNLRGKDTPHSCPVAAAFLYLAPEGSTVFIDRVKLTPEVERHFADAGIAVRPYDDVLDFLGSLPADVRVLISATRAPGAVATALGERAVIGESPVQLMKAVKNEVQIEGVRRAHVRDGVAMVRSIFEIKKKIADGEELTEIDCADILERNRSEQDLYFDLSFDTIAGFGPNGAIVHYSATPESNTVIRPGSLLLLDSGANYLDATTDITRTISTGNPTPEMRHDFTLVMKGHIAIATAIFPEGTTGHQLDAMARMPLWKEGKSYLHGTGHGVGLFLFCHEGPQSIRLNDTHAPLTPGMLTSNEPGLYLTGRYGIRCENLVLTVPYETTEFGNFYAFDTVTLCPFDRSLFDISIMTADEIAWVDDYHKRVYEALAPHLGEDERRQLAEATRPLS